MTASPKKKAVVPALEQEVVPMPEQDPTLEQEIAAPLVVAEVVRERARELLDLFAEQQRNPGEPAPARRQHWEARALTHDPVLALAYALKEANVC